ncbi:hypothetical protein VSH64_06185 [Amycolatopsis rhabdoformis]|uniref:Uncharacterized protein n=1 Tax=Amycolatopsis rhabdoformis TaxID=1448059 RepID=A0ABZ1IB50_9PSEU|nr:hypothetical protein [Amycolatopsis rhabdoformis]WSE31696.1 hypothetical protein VSH64_06185 [Amycolatopsis rhabdoformis]
MGLFAMVVAALPLAGGPLTAALLVLRRRPALRSARATRAARVPARLAEELRAIAEVLPRVRPVLTPGPRTTTEPVPLTGPCQPCLEAVVPQPRRAPAPAEPVPCLTCSR